MMPGSDGQVPTSVQPEGEKQMRRRVRIIGDKFCKVCGDKALAHHFGALTCNTCKIFFRRNALKVLEMRPCSADKKCNISQNTRRNCPACRLKKCFDVGMKSELIFGEEQRRELSQKVQKNRLKRQGHKGTAVENPNERDPSPAVTSGTRVSPHNPDEDRGVMLHPSSVYACSASSIANGDSQSAADGDSLVTSVSGMVVDDHVQRVSPCSGSSAGPARTDLVVPVQMSDSDHHWGEEPKALGDKNSHNSHDTFQESSTGTARSGCSLELVPQQHPSKVDLSQLSRNQLPSDPQMYWRLSEDERIILTLLTGAYENTVLASLKECQTFPRFDMFQYTMDDFMSDYDAQCRHAVNFVKQLQDFQKLKLDDQIACIKGSMGQVLAVRNAFVFVMERKAWITMKGELTEGFVRKIFPYNPCLQWGTELSHSLKSVAKNDITLYALLHCILLFDPSINKLTNRQQVGVIQDKYVVLLRHYLESVFSYSYANDYLSFFHDTMIQACQLGEATTKLAREMEYPGMDEFLRYEMLMEVHDYA